MHRPSLEITLLAIAPQLAVLFNRPEDLSLPAAVAGGLAFSFLAWAFFASVAHALNLFFKSSRYRLETSQLLSSPFLSFAILMLTFPYLAMEDEKDDDLAENVCTPQVEVSMPSANDK